MYILFYTSFEKRIAYQRRHLIYSFLDFYFFKATSVLIKQENDRKQISHLVTPRILPKYCLKAIL